MSRQLSFRGSASVTLSGSGAGIAQAGPRVPGETWFVTGCAVSVATNVNEAQAYVYYSPAGPFTPQASELLGATSTGSTGDSFGPNIDLYPGQQLTAQWVSGDAGQVATVTYWGTRTVP